MKCVHYNIKNGQGGEISKEKIDEEGLYSAIDIPWHLWNISSAI